MTAKKKAIKKPAPANVPFFFSGRPRMAAVVADACDLPCGAGFLIAFFFAVTISKFKIQIWQ